jgi:hypothetical protein
MTNTQCSRPGCIRAAGIKDYCSPMCEWLTDERALLLDRLETAETRFPDHEALIESTLSEQECIDAMEEWLTTYFDRRKESIRLRKSANRKERRRRDAQRKWEPRG